MSGDRPFRFYDNRQKYLTFVNTCDEKWRVAERIAAELDNLAPAPPALRVFDAGVGDGTVLAHVLSAMHARFPNVPFCAVAKEISLEDIRLTLEKLPDRFVEHPEMVVVLTNLHYAESPWLRPNTDEKAERMVLKTVALDGQSSYGFGDQLRALDPFLADHWTVAPSPKTGNPLYVTPTVVVLHRSDRAFVLDDVLASVTAQHADYDLVIASQPWRSRQTAKFKVGRILCPLTRALRSRGTLIGIQSRGADPGLEIVQRIWPDADPFPVGRHELIDALRVELGDAAHGYDLLAMSDADSLLRYRMHTLPTEIGNQIGTSTLFAAWNAAIYVAQIEDDRVEAATIEGKYLDATAQVLKEHGALWFNDETFVVRKH